MRSVVSWNALTSGYLVNGLFQEVLDLFREMLACRVNPNEVTVVPVLQAIAHLGSLSQGQWVEAFVQRRRIKVDFHLAAAMVDMYGKCGSMVNAWRIFEEFQGRRNTILCSSMIDVLAAHGKPEEAFEVFKTMPRDGIQPNEITFLGLLKACSHSGKVETGLNTSSL